MNIGYVVFIILGSSLVVSLILANFIRYRNVKHLQSLTSYSSDPGYRVSSGFMNSAVRLQCYNFRLALFLASSFFWLISFFVVLMIIQTETRHHPPFYMALINGLLTKRTIMTIALLWAGGWVYYAYHLIRVEWTNTLVVGDKSLHVVFYEVKKNGIFFNMIYLQTEDKLWVLVPSTTQDTGKIRDLKRMEKEKQQNEKYVEQLSANLVNYGAQNKSFPLLTPYFKTSVMVWVATLILLIALAL